jgi:hypothetical protein
MRGSKRTSNAKWIDGLGYCVEVVHTDEVGKYDYTSYTPIETLTKL